MGRGSVAAGEIFWLRLTTTSAQCLRLLWALFSLPSKYEVMRHVSKQWSFHPRWSTFVQAFVNFRWHPGHWDTPIKEQYTDMQHATMQHKDEHKINQDAHGDRQSTANYIQSTWLQGYYYYYYSFLPSVSIPEGGLKIDENDWKGMMLSPSSRGPAGCRVAEQHWNAVPAPKLADTND